MILLIHGILKLVLFGGVNKGLCVCSCASAPQWYLIKFHLNSFPPHVQRQKCIVKDEQTLLSYKTPNLST